MLVSDSWVAREPSIAATSLSRLLITFDRPSPYSRNEVQREGLPRADDYETTPNGKISSSHGWIYLSAWHSTQSWPPSLIQTMPLFYWAAILSVPNGQLILGSTWEASTSSHPCALSV